MLVTWKNVLIGSFQNLWYGIASYVPVIVAAIIVVIVGWLIAIFVGIAIEKLVQAIRLDDVLRKGNFDKLLARGGIRLNSGAFIGGVIKWFIIIAFLITAIDVLGLGQVREFLVQLVAGFIPQVIIAAIILVAGAVLADISDRIVTGAVAAAGVRYSKLIGTIARWAIWIFAILTALLQLGIAAPLIQTLFTGVVIAFALAFGLAFGFGGQNEAARLIEKTRERISSNQ
jgi:hypothetical protein